MGWLARLFNITPKAERSGICLGTKAYWEVSGSRDYPSFFRALARLVPEDAILYLEGDSLAKAIQQFLNARCVPEISHVAISTIWPKPQVHHLPVTEDNLCSLADLAENCAAPEVADHIHVYKDDEVLLEWYDAVCGDTMYLSASILEPALRQFCGQLSLTYGKFDGGTEPRDQVEHK